MHPIDYFKLQARNLLKDFKTKQPYFDEVIGDWLYKYDPKYFDIEGIICDFDMDEENFSLMKAQHIIAYLVGFRKWTDILSASDTEIELAQLLFENQDKISAEDWKMYLEIAEKNNGMTYDPTAKLEIFKQVFLNGEGNANPPPDYRIIGQN